MSLQIAEMHEDPFGLSRESSQAGSLSERRNNKAKKKHFMTDQEIEELLREEGGGGGKGRKGGGGGKGRNLPRSFPLGSLPLKRLMSRWTKK